MFQNPDPLIEIAIRAFRDEDQKYFKEDLQNDGLIDCYYGRNPNAFATSLAKPAKVSIFPGQ